MSVHDTFLLRFAAGGDQGAAGQRGQGVPSAGGPGDPAAAAAERCAARRSLRACHNKRVGLVPHLCKCPAARFEGPIPDQHPLQHSCMHSAILSGPHALLRLIAWHKRYICEVPCYSVEGRCIAAAAHAGRAAARMSAWASCSAHVSMSSALRCYCTFT